MQTVSRFFNAAASILINRDSEKAEFPKKTDYLYVGILCADGEFKLQKIFGSTPIAVHNSVANLYDTSSVNNRFYLPRHLNNGLIAWYDSRNQGKENVIGSIILRSPIHGQVVFMGQSAGDCYDSVDIVDIRKRIHDAREKARPKEKKRERTPTPPMEEKKKEPVVIQDGGRVFTSILLGKEKRRKKNPPSPPLRRSRRLAAKRKDD